MCVLSRINYPVSQWFQVKEFSVWVFVAPLTILRFQFKCELLVNSLTFVASVPRQLFLLNLGIVCFIFCSSLSILMLYNLEGSIDFDGSVYFVTMTISTIGFGEDKFRLV